MDIGEDYVITSIMSDAVNKFDGLWLKNYMTRVPWIRLFFLSIAASMVGILYSWSIQTGY